VDDDIERHLPLSPLEFSILLLLIEDGAAYGYGIVKGIAARSRGSVQLAPGNLYAVLDRLSARGWIRGAKASELPEGGDERRQYYGITPRGRQVAAAEASRLRALVPTLDRLNLAPAQRRKS
jgi:DNA-binding PadR family transcriptional regulator